MRKILFALLALVACSAPAQQLRLPKEVQAVIDRSHNSRTDYSVFLAVEITTAAGAHREMQAEFQHSPWHRVEVSIARVLANCESGKQVVYNVVLAKFTAGPDQGACGISMTSDETISGKMLPRVNGSYGSADVIELTGKKFIRRYAVTPDGIIVATSYEPRSADVGFSLRTLSAQVIRGAPDPEMFRPESLERAYAPKDEAARQSRPKARRS